MASPIWLTPVGSLGNIPESIYFELQLDAYNSLGGSLTYALIAGTLPSGLSLSSTGLISGIPNAVTKITTSTFTIRVTNNTNAISDRTFSIGIGGLLPPVIVPESGSLGSFLDGTYVDLQITATEPTGLLTSTFSLLTGNLPPGLTLTSAGRIYGYITPVANTQGGAVSGFDATPFDLYGFEFIGDNISKNYQFSIKADDGAKTDINNFTIFVYTRSNLTADNYIALDDPSRSANSNIISADSIILTADIDKIYSPILLTPAGSVGSIRQNTLFQFKFDGVDYDSDTITYNVNANALPTGLSLNSTTGWLTGVVPYGPLGSVTYPFTVNVTKQVDSITYSSQTKSFSVKIEGQVSDIVNWNTASNIGNIYNGSISEFQISASTQSNRVLSYALTTASIGGLPIGLDLLSDGTISGRVSFDITGSETYTFTVAAFDSDNLVYDEKEFSITVVERDVAPYENLYIQALPNRTQRSTYDAIINNSDIFPVESIYRYSDPWFGKNLNRRSLFMTGINSEDVSTYIAAMSLNHYWKKINFGEIKTAQSLDNNFNVVYEVVYVELIDSSVNASGLGPNLAISLPLNSANVSTIYPNSFPNMVERIATGVGYENRSILPGWMTSRQTNGTVLGFTRALVLCYTLPGKSSEIAFRVKQVADQFNNIDFTIDRYEWDSILSDNWTGNAFIANNYTAGSGTITSLTTSNVVIGSNTTIAGSGNITGISGSVDITGDQYTSFNTELRIGKIMYVANTAIGTISSISNASSLSLAEPLTSNITSAAYSVTGNLTAFTSELHLGDVIVSNGNVIGTVKTITSDFQLVLTANANVAVSNQAFTHTTRDPYTTPGQGDKYLKFPNIRVITSEFTTPEY